MRLYRGEKNKSLDVPYERLCIVNLLPQKLRNLSQSNIKGVREVFNWKKEEKQEKKKVTYITRKPDTKEVFRDQVAMY